jgi:hypothetical protein
MHSRSARIAVVPKAPATVLPWPGGCRGGIRRRRSGPGEYGIIIGRDKM